MSIEEFSAIYLQCDYVYGNDVRCPVTYPYSRRDGWPDNSDALEVLCRKARGEGWQAEPQSQGMKGWVAPALCPDHTTPPADASP